MKKTKTTGMTFTYSAAKKAALKKAGINITYEIRKMLDKMHEKVRK